MSTKSATLPYQGPWLIFLPTVVIFLVFNFLVLCANLNSDGTDLVLSPQVAAVIQNPDKVEVSVPTRFLVFFENIVLRNYLHVGLRVFGSMYNIRVVWVVAWFIHCLETGMAFRICLSCNAKPFVFATYIVCTIFGGVTQLSPLIGAKKEYERRLGMKLE